MQKRAQFDDRIRNLIALAQDGSEHSRTLLFSHISDLFLQNHPMASAVQIRMLTDILKELLGQVALSARLEIASALNALTSPPKELIDIMCEDVVAISGPLLEKAIIPDEKLIHIIRYGTEPHRIHISRRFGLSPLVRHELEKAHAQSDSSKLKYSLNELDKHAEDQTPDMDEATTANILELLRAQKIHGNYPEKLPENMLATVKNEKNSTLSITKTVNEKKPEKTIEKEDFHPIEMPHKDGDDIFLTEVAANDTILPYKNDASDSTIQIADIPMEMNDHLMHQVHLTRDETHRQREFVRTVADWFWEVDRAGLISFISDEAFIVFGRSAPTLVGEDFISLCTKLNDGSNSNNDIEKTTHTFESLFEHRTSFRNVPFYITTQNEEKTLWHLSAIAIFDIHSGRFTGFRGSAHAQASEKQISSAPVSSPASNDPGHQEEVLEEYITNQALKAVMKTFPNQENTTKEPDNQEQGNKEQEHFGDKEAAELIQNLSHEFRTPLNAIIGFSEMIHMETWGPVNKQYHQNIKNILTAAGQLKEAVNDVLDSARLESGLMHITPESFSLKSVLKSCRENVADMAKEKNVQLSDNVNNIDVILYNDIQSVELCLTKMLTCIIKRATGGETISPSILINSQALVRIELPFLGLRIDEKYQDTMFQRLDTGPNEHKNLAQNEINYGPKLSSGFGLSVAQKLAHIIGGDISVHTARGYITHLVLTLSNHDPAS